MMLIIKKISFKTPNSSLFQYQDNDISDVFTWQEDIQSYYMCKQPSLK